MRKFILQLRSMRFGLILMGLAAALCLVGSFFPQGQSADWYAQNYLGMANIILALRLDRIFSSWYFITLLVLLCVNLSLCSAARIRYALHAQELALSHAGAGDPEHALSHRERSAFIDYLVGRKYRRAESGCTILFYKNALGYYGSTLVHISFLLTLIVGASVSYFSQTDDYTVFPGESLALADGTTLYVDSFRIEDESGRQDYVSEIRVASKDGVTVGPRAISVNYPFSYGGYKFYQQSYGTAGSITAIDLSTGGSDVFILTEPSFLSADGRNGVWYEQLYPGYVRDDDGNFTLISSTSGAYRDPVYQVHVMSDGELTSVLGFVGETMTIGDISFTFNQPVAYPGIRVKLMSRVLLSLLYAVFVIMVLGFWLCFFHSPVVIAIYRSGYTAYGSSAAGIKLETDLLFENIARGNET